MEIPNFDLISEANLALPTVSAEPLMLASASLFDLVKVRVRISLTMARQKDIQRSNECCTAQRHAVPEVIRFAT